MSTLLYLTLAKLKFCKNMVYGTGQYSTLYNFVYRTPKGNTLYSIPCLYGDSKIVALIYSTVPQKVFKATKFRHFHHIVSEAM